MRQRVVQAAEAALHDHQYVSAIDILTGTRVLEPTHLESWKKGRVDFLERVIQGNLSKISDMMAIFRSWAIQKALKPRETAYVRRAPSGLVNLRFSVGGDPGIERNYRTHYVSPALSERKQQQLTEKLSSAAAPVVFSVLRDSECSECGAEIGSGSFLLMEAEQPLCLPCARLGDLEYLAAGDTALTRRATKYGERTAVVVRFSRSRGRYERQGVLVEKAALEKAEKECAGDAGDRAKARTAAAGQREKQDYALVEQWTARIGGLFPRCPPAEAAAIAGHAAVRGSGRVGRTAAGRQLEEQAIAAAVAAAVRHRHTDYDELLASGVDRTAARVRVAEKVRETLAVWRE